MIYEQVKHEGAMIHTPDGETWMVDFVEVTEGNGVYEVEAVAYLSKVPKEKP